MHIYSSDCEKTVIEQMIGKDFADNFFAILGLVGGFASALLISKVIGSGDLLNFLIGAVLVMLGLAFGGRIPNWTEWIMRKYANS